MEIKEKIKHFKTPGKLSKILICEGAHWSMIELVLQLLQIVTSISFLLTVYQSRENKQ